MKIALAMERFSVHAGGAEAYSVRLAGTLVREGWEVHLFGHEWDGEPEGAVFHPIPRLPKVVPPSVRILHFALAHRRLVRRYSFDVVVGFGNTLEMNVYQSHGGVHHFSSMRKLGAVRNPAARALKALALFLTPKHYARAWVESAPFRMEPRPIIIAISDMVRDDMSARFRVPKDSIRLVYNGIETDRFARARIDHRSDVRRSMGFGDRVVFLFMAYDFRKKGVRYLLEAAALLRDRVGENRFAVLVVGGSPSPALRNLVRRRDLEGIVTFPGPTKEPEKLYAACDVFILPTFYDACSLVVFEAMAAGLPAITTVHNGAAGIIEQGVCGLVLQDPADVEAMVSAMESFLEREFLERASRAARETAARYDIETNHKRMIEIFRGLLSDPLRM